MLTIFHIYKINFFKFINFLKIKMNLNEIHNSIIDNLSLLDIDNDEKRINHPTNIFESYANDEEYFLFCRKCFSPPEIIFIDLSKINIECQCSHAVNTSLQYVLKNYLIKGEKDQTKEKREVNNYFQCEKHLMKYVAYCDDCLIDICERCLADKCHFNHTKFRFPNIYEKSKDFISYYISSSPEIISNYGKGKSTLMNLINAELNSYKNYPCYINYKNLNNLFIFLRQNKDKNNNKNINQNENNKKELFIKIKTVKELKNIIKDNPDKLNTIESINIQTQNFYDLSFLKINESSVSYDNLIELNLKKNNISNITSFISINLPELKNLNLSMNRLSDQSIGDIHNLFKTCPKLTKLDLSSHAFTDYILLEFIKEFKYLKKLYLGNNKFHFNNKNIKYQKYKFDLSNIEELGLSSGVFSKQSIELMKNFKLDNLKKLYLRSNNLTSLSFVEKINCDKLEELSLSNNYLKEFYKLKKFKQLKLINLKGNRIGNISKLSEFLSELPDIEKIILSDNKIDLNIIKNYEIIEKAIKQRNLKNDKIQIII